MSLTAQGLSSEGTGLGRAAFHCYLVLKVVLGCIPFFLKLEEMVAEGGTKTIGADLQEWPHQLVPSGLEISLQDLLRDAVDEAAERHELVQQEEDQLRRSVPPEQVSWRRICDKNVF